VQNVTITNGVMVAVWGCAKEISFEAALLTLSTEVDREVLMAVLRMVSLVTTRPVIVSVVSVVAVVVSTAATGRVSGHLHHHFLMLPMTRLGTRQQPPPVDSKC